MKKLQFILFVCTIILSSCESDEIIYRELEIKSGIRTHNAGTVFKNVPVEFFCELVDTTREFPELDVLWSEVDSNISINERSFFYTYTKNGYYNPTVKIYDSENNLINVREENPFYWEPIYDTYRFKVTDYPKIIGEENLNEKGKYIYLNGSNYSIIYSLQSESNPEELFLKVVDDDFSEVSNIKLNVETPGNIISSFLNNSGTIVLITDNYFYEFSLSGILIQKVIKSKNYNSVISISTGYSAISVENNNIRVDLLNDNFIITETKLVEFTEPDYQVLDVDQFKNGKYVILCKSENRYSTSLFELYGEEWIESMSSGATYFKDIVKVFYYLDKKYLIGITDRNFCLYSTVDSYDDYMNNNYPDYDGYLDYKGSYSYGNIENPTIDFIDNILLHSNMQFESVDYYYYVRFGLEYDAFNNAIKNTAGKIVILGTKQVPIDGITTELQFNTDLLLIKVDSKGDPVN